MNLLIRLLAGIIVAWVLIWLLPFSWDWVVALLAFLLVVFYDAAGGRGWR